jgi:hypothetical protein
MAVIAKKMNRPHVQQFSSQQVACSLCFEITEFFYVYTVVWGISKKVMALNFAVVEEPTARTYFPFMFSFRRKPVLSGVSASPYTAP